MKTMMLILITVVTVLSALSILVYAGPPTTAASAYIPGTDITEQLRNDLNAGLDVKLPAGHYYVSESIAVHGYSGTVKGAGKNRTTIEAAQGFKALPQPFFSWGEFEIAEMLAFVWSEGDVTLEDMTILVRGDAPAQPHNNPFFLEPITTIDNAIVVAAAGPEAESGITVTFKNLRIMGEDTDAQGSINGKNLVYPLIATGWQGYGPISAVIKNCEIQNSGDSAIEYFDAHEGSAEIENNRISNSYGGIWLGWGLELAEVTVKNNRFTNITVDPIQAPYGIGSYCFKKNRLDGARMPDDC